MSKVLTGLIVYSPLLLKDWESLYTPLKEEFMKLHSLMLGSVLLLLAACKENQTFRNQFKLPDSTSPVTSDQDLTKIYSLKKIGYRCDLITDSEVKDIFIRINYGEEPMKLTFHDYKEDGNISVVFASIANFKINSAEMAKAPAPKGSFKWIGETGVIVDEKINEMGESIRAANVKVTFNADPLDETVEIDQKIEAQGVKVDTKIIVDMKVSGKFEVSELVRTEPTKFERRDFRDLATFENCEEIEALQIGIK
jgi:hypothetical protein